MFDGVELAAINTVTSFIPADFAATAMLSKLHVFVRRYTGQNLLQLAVVHVDVPSLFAPSVRSIHIL